MVMTTRAVLNPESAAMDVKVVAPQPPDFDGAGRVCVAIAAWGMSAVQ